MLPDHGPAPWARQLLAYARNSVPGRTAWGLLRRSPFVLHLVNRLRLAARQEAWARLDADAEWIDMQGESIARH